ncbi:ATPase, T2SS/T4P/T4SS family [Megasphaera paucivorans]|uniref:Twitching motility protein PilT n=1 Tax=Megasphaera paucivorans TaxID=349095 RepID=A0A1G9UHS4_9FIRM|nr:ATPase, T2SS/T4P/T4SS family [Megasphaera paucivorans]SDM59480.1 twitching motility protein PilT [Megasphaera paucivorans]
MDITAIISTAIERKATDIHLQEHRLPLLRTGMELFPLEGAVVKSCDISSWLHVYDCKLPRCGELSLAVDLQEGIRCRINIFPEYAGYHAALRLLYPLHWLPTDEDAVILERLSQMKHGLVLITGPTASGKTTTLWRIMEYLNNSRRCHLITLEDPIEYILPGKKALISQRELGKHFSTFQDGVRQALRQDPDVILVGEMRDGFTMEAALTAAETGHLVFSTLHTTSAAQTISRVVGAVPAVRQEELRCRLSMVLQAVLAQQRFCDDAGTHVAREVLFRTTAVAQLIRTGREYQLESILQTGAAYGMRTMEQALAFYGKKL